MALSRHIAFRGHVKAPLEALGVEREQAVVADATLPVRLRDLLRRLRAPSRRVAACEAVLRALPLSHSPHRVAAHIVDCAFDWLGGQGWATLGQEEGRGLSWLCDRGVANTRRSAVTALASRVVDTGEPEWAEDASRLGPTHLRGPFAAIGFPLRSQGRVVGVLAGIDRQPPADAAQAAASRSLGGPRGSIRSPRPEIAEGGRPFAGQGLDAGCVGAVAAAADEDLAAFWLLLDPMAAALDAALRLSRAENLSSIDDLTGLYNSRFLAGALQRESKRALRTHRPLSVLFVDLDGFKGINDRWGHLSGSRALVEAATRIASGARETDVVARYGGDEFALVLPETPAEGAMIVAQRVRERIASHAFLQEEGIGYRLTASVGVATLPEAARTPEELLAAADAAMYRVKARGKDGIESAGQATGKS